MSKGRHKCLHPSPPHVEKDNENDGVNFFYNYFLAFTMLGNRSQEKFNKYVSSVNI